MHSPETASLSVSSAEQTILRWDSAVSGESRDRMIFSGDRQEINLYMQAVNQLQLSLQESNDPRKPSSSLQIAMSRLQDEFRDILVTSSSPVEARVVDDRVVVLEEDGLRNELENQESTTSGNIFSILDMDLISSDAIHDLRSIAEVMMKSGYSRECVQVYGSVRRLFVELNLRKLGIEKLSIEDVQRLDWDILETKIRRWIKGAKVCVRVIFRGEKKFCEQIFEGLGGDIYDSCFMEMIKGPAEQLFNFAEAISISSREPEKLFKILDLHDVLSDLLTDIETVFDSKYSQSLRVQAEEILSRLAEAVRGIVLEFENKVLSEPSKVAVPGGTIHPLTRYVMNYISLISDYKETLNELIVSKPYNEGMYSGEPILLDFDVSEMGNQSPLALHLIWMIALLECNLEAKSKYYKDASLAQLFIMNNLHYITHKIKESNELREMIEDNYLRKLTGKFRFAATKYQRSTWVRVLHCLRDEGLHVRGGFSSGVSRSALRERFKSFNAIFEDVHQTQAMWLVPDTQLREELQISIAAKLLPAYRSFLGRFRGHIESGRRPENYLKYSVEDLEAAVFDLFEGIPYSQHLRKRYQ